MDTASMAAQKFIRTVMELGDSSIFRGEHRASKIAFAWIHIAAVGVGYVEIIKSLHINSLLVTYKE
jgi:hypothetical protein